MRVYDTESEARRTFRGIESYPIDPGWRLEATFEPYEPGRVTVIPTVMEGVEERYPTPGALAFEVVGGGVHRLDTFVEQGSRDLFIIFGDRTNGRETYGGGRFVYARRPGKGGTTVIDFNKAYNPPCVFSAFTTCALPLPQNRLPIRVEAGEKRYS